MALSRHRRFETSELGDEFVLTLTDKKILESSTIELLGADLDEVVSTLGQKKILIDFGKVEYLCSAVLGELITFQKKIGAAGGQVALCNMPPHIFEVFHQTRLDTVFKIRPSKGEDAPGAGPGK